MQEFRDRRLEEVKSLRMDYVPCFHDSKNWLICVEEECSRLADTVRPAAPLVTSIARYLLPKMLCANAQERWNSEKVVEHADELLAMMPVAASTS